MVDLTRRDVLKLPAATLCQTNNCHDSGEVTCAVEVVGLLGYNDILEIEAGGWVENLELIG